MMADEQQLEPATGHELDAGPEEQGREVPGAMDLDEALAKYDDAGQAVAEGGADRPPASPEAPPPQLDDDGLPARDEHGRFVARETKAEEEQPSGDDPVPLSEGFEIPQDDEELEVEAEAEEEVEPEGEPGLVKLELPGEGEDDEPIELEVDDPDVAERIQGLQAKASRVDEVTQRAERAENDVREVLDLRQQLLDVQEDIADDPIGFITEQFTTPERRAEVALDLLLDDHVFRQITEKLDEWIDNPLARKEQRLNRRAEREQQIRERQEYRQQRDRAIAAGRKIVGQIKSFIPDDMDGETAQRFEADMIRDFREWLDANGRPTNVPQEQVRKVLQYRLNQYGVEVSENGDKPATSKAAKAKKAAARITKSRQRRRAAAASAPAGSGTPAGKIRQPAGASLDEALEHAEKLVRGG